MATNTHSTARKGPSGAWNRLKPFPSDPFDAYGLPSKGETRLHDSKIQEAYYSKIVARYMTFCASTGSNHDLSTAFSSLAIEKLPSQPQASVQPILPSSSSSSFSSSSNPTIISSRPSAPDPNTTSDLPNILLAMRKLREAILGARRTDAFAQRAYAFIIRASILARAWEAYQPALLHLLHHMHPPHSPPHHHQPLSAPEQQEFAAYWVLDLACRQDDLGAAVAARRAAKLRDRRVGAVLRALMRDDWVAFWRVLRAVDGYQRAIMEFAGERMRLHALKCLGRSYLNADRAFVERCGNASWEELVGAGVGWQLQENGNVIIRKPKPK